MSPYGSGEARWRRGVDRWVVLRFGAALRLLVALGFAPWVITVAGLACAVTGALMAPLSWGVGLGLHVVGVLLDGLDGAAARASGRASLHGAALDVWADWFGSAAWVVAWGWGAGSGGLSLLYAAASWWLLGLLEILAAEGRAPRWVLRPRVPVLVASVALWWCGVEDLGAWIPLVAVCVVVVCGKLLQWGLELKDEEKRR